MLDRAVRSAQCESPDDLLAHKGRRRRRIILLRSELLNDPRDEYDCLRRGECVGVRNVTMCDLLCKVPSRANERPQLSMGFPARFLSQEQVKPRFCISGFRGLGVLRHGR